MIKKIVIDLDGATFDLLNPWTEDGELPNIKKLIADGTSAVMVSCLPSVTVQTVNVTLRVRDLESWVSSGGNRFSKYPGPEDQALVIPKGDLLC